MFWTPLAGPSREPSLTMTSPTPIYEVLPPQWVG